MIDSNFPEEWSPSYPGEIVDLYWEKLPDQGSVQKDLEEQQDVMSAILEYISFLIRVWRVPESNLNHKAAQLQIEVEHIQSGQSWTFDTFEELNAFLLQKSAGPGGITWIEMRQNNLFE